MGIVHSGRDNGGEVPVSSIRLFVWRVSFLGVAYVVLVRIQLFTSPPGERSRPTYLLTRVRLGDADARTIALPTFGPRELCER